MLIAILICSITACSLALGMLVITFMFINTSKSKLEAIKSSLTSEHAEIRARVAESNRAAMDEVRAARIAILEAIPPVSSLLDKQNELLKTHVSTKVDASQNAQEALSKQILDSLSKYTSIIESQERLIEGVEHYAFASKKGRRHD